MSLPSEELKVETTELQKEVVELNYDDSLFRILIPKEGILGAANEGLPLQAEFLLKPELENVYDKIKSEDKKTVVIIPLFTASAYTEPGFYSFYREECDSRCLTVPIMDRSSLDDTSSVNAVKILELLGYDTITDVDVDKNPKILKNYDKIILLHNEYVTKTMFEAITSHPNVVYLYPNALYAEISTDYEKNTISLIRGHNYPSPEIINGFDWEFENTHPYEYDIECMNWEFYEIDNGVMLNCFPEKILWKNQAILETIKGF